MNSEQSSFGSNRSLSLPGTGTTAVRLVAVEPMEPESGPKSDSSGMLEYWQLIRDRKWTIVIMAVLGLLGAFLITFEQVPIYQTRTTIEVQNLSDTSSASMIDQGGGGMFTPETYIQTQVRILQSNSLRSRVNAKMKQEKRPEWYQQPDRFAGLRQLLHLPPRSNTIADRNTLPAVGMYVKPYENTRIIEILCDSANPQMAAEFANTMTNEYIEYHLEARWNAAQRATQWLTRQLQNLKVKLQESEDRLQNYSRATGLIFTGEKENVEQEKLAQLQSELSRAEADRVARQSAFEIASANQAETVPQIIDNGRLSEYQSKLADLRRELAELSASLTPEHYRVIRVQAQIKELENTLKRERENIITRIRNDYQAALRREKLLSAAYANQAWIVSEQARKSVNYDILRREVESNRRLYDELLQKVQGTGLAAAMNASNIRVVDPAVPPGSPYKPSLMRNLMMGLAAGIMLGIAMVIAADHVNRSLKAPGETPFHLKVPELGVIPDRSSVPAKELRDAKVLSLSGGQNGHSTDPESHMGLITWQNRPSLLAESFRSALASILVSERNGQRPRVILVTSAGRGEGKSSTVSNLGIALAEINQRVLLLDADMRKPHLHQIFSAPNSWGLSDLLREKTPLKDMPVEALARETEIAGLHILPSGPGTLSIANLLYSSRMSELLQRLRAEFDMVLIDTPPMLYLSDARVLGRLADAAILVVRAGQTTRDDALGAKQRLVDDGIHVLGTILNGWDSKAKTRYGYYAYPYPSREPGEV